MWSNHFFCGFLLRFTFLIVWTNLESHEHSLRWYRLINVFTRSLSAQNWLSGHLGKKGCPTTGSFDSSFSWFSVILIKLHEKVIMMSVVCYVNIRVCRGKFQLFRDWWIDCQHGPWKRVLTPPVGGVHGQKHSTTILFFALPVSTASEQG